MLVINHLIIQLLFLYIYFDFSYDIACMWNQKKRDTNELIYKTEIDPQTQKTNFWLPKRKAEGGIN